ncbi:hypothetical protein D9758_003428 [Tetrapyrgos nigripes]|uniref:Uncharacterized protein n=1 Tax=Tetrapyrgos nigripes TaxID=182062 RepID=A0A8H5GV38_9AGAR|nr:hypothetical protein D9758_003428 [Tetrapyrgos nigripes]
MALAWTSLWILLFPVSACLASILDTLPPLQRRVFEYGMTGLDVNFGGPGTLLFDSPRYTAWYAVGLLARNEGNDVEVASGLLEQVVSYQFKDPSKVWFGTFKNDPNEPDPMEDVFEPKIYTSYDPNQALFVTTSFIVIMEEFRDLLEPNLVSLLKESMYNATVGDGYRNGGINGDNLYPVYSNPWYMRVMAATYVGNMMSDPNMTHWGNVWAEQGIAEFDRYGTLNEFNSGTYTGVTLYALSLWGYMPQNSTIVIRAKDIITKTWTSVGHFYNPTLHTLGGPWDRTYGYDMRRYFGILGVQISGLIGGIENKTAPLPVPLVGSKHYSDAAIMTLIPLTSKFHDPYVPSSVLTQLQTLDSSKDQSYFTQAISPPFDNLSYPRNYTAWKGRGISVGGIQVDNAQVGGAALNPTAFSPAQILWASGEGKGTGMDSEVGWILHYPTSSVISAVATSTNLTISYPPSKAFPSNSSSSSNIMSLLISGLKRVSLGPDFLANGTGELPGLRLDITGNFFDVGNVSVGNAINVDINEDASSESLKRTLVYGANTINDFSFYNLTYYIPTSFQGTPEVTIAFEKL